MRDALRKLTSMAAVLFTAVSVWGAPEPKTPLIVARDGSGDFTTIQDAVYAVRDYTPVPITIEVRNGVYHEKLIIPSWKCDITIKGESRDGVVITHADAAGDPTVYFGKEMKEMGTFRTHTVYIGGNDITFENLTIENASEASGQRVALHTEGTRTIIRNCTIKGHQDTVFTGNTEAYVYFDNCEISGTTDFIFGPATCWFEKCDIISLSNSYITAASTSPEREFGYVFNECRLTAGGSAEKVYLGRPWRKDAATVFMRCDLGGHIRPEGWENWRNPENEKTARYGEYRCNGEGADRSGRVGWCRELTDTEAAAYTRDNVLGGDWWRK